MLARFNGHVNQGYRCSFQIGRHNNPSETTLLGSVFFFTVRIQGVGYSCYNRAQCNSVQSACAQTILDAVIRRIPVMSRLANVNNVRYDIFWQLFYFCRIEITKLLTRTGYIKQWRLETIAQYLIQQLF